MKILVAVNEFKGSLTSREIAELISKLANERYKNIEIEPEVIADGGDGFLDIFNNFKIFINLIIFSFFKMIFIF